jgi:hypothetical protein
MQVDPSSRSSTYGQECLCVVSVSIPLQIANKPTKHYDLEGMFLRHLRQLAKQMGLKNCGTFSKYDCRKYIGTLLKFHSSMEDHGLNPRTQVGLKTSSICRAVNVVFSSSFIESFRTVNNSKTREDHETKNTNKQFWSDATIAYNDCDTGESEGKEDDQNNNNVSTYSICS